MNRPNSIPGFSSPSASEIMIIISDENATEKLVSWADKIGSQLKNQGLTTNQIRAIFGEVRQIEAEWSMEGQRERAVRRLILLKPKMSYRSRKERGKAVQALVAVLDPALDIVIGERNQQKQDDNFRRFVEFFEAILAYHKAYGGN